MMKKLMATSVVATMLFAGTFGTTAFAKEETNNTSYNDNSFFNLFNNFDGQDLLSFFFSPVSPAPKQTPAPAAPEAEPAVSVPKASPSPAPAAAPKAAAPKAAPSPAPAAPTTAAPSPAPAAPTTAAPSPAPAAPTTAAPASAASTTQADKLIAFAESLQGKVHYGYAKRVTSNPNNLILDCSSFTQYVYKQALGVKMGWGANAQHNAFPHVAKTDLRKGDLVFFSVSNPSKIGHVGIYMGGGKFIHNVNPKSNVVISDLTTGYWQRHYIDGARPLK